jgi:hypothetical protein
LIIARAGRREEVGPRSSQRDGGIDFQRAPQRHVTRDERHAHKQQRHDGIGGRIGRSHPPELRRDETCECQRAGEADEQADRDEPPEKWPRQLFVDSERSLEALDFFLKTGKQAGRSTRSEPTHFLAK